MANGATSGVSKPGDRVIVMKNVILYLGYSYLYLYLYSEYKYNVLQRLVLQYSGVRSPELLLLDLPVLEYSSTRYLYSIYIRCHIMMMLTSIHTIQRCDGVEAFHKVRVSLWGSMLMF